MTLLELTPDELLTTTRAVRKRLDLGRPVERGIIEECVAIAQQAPNGSNLQKWHFVIVTDPAKRAAIAEFYRRGAEFYFASPPAPTGGINASNEEAVYRLRSSALYLVEHIHEVPVHVIPCILGRTDGLPSARQAATWASIMPATWSLMLALRARGLGSAFTTFHLYGEKEAARLLGIPYKDVMQAGLVPVAYTKGTDFKPAKREPLSTMIHWNAW
jgi:nitroreductase